MMPKTLSFRARGGAALRYLVDFSIYDYANISFFDAARAEILFHLSLRARSGLAVTNRRGLNGWETERPHPAGFLQQGNEVEIRFPQEGGVEVWLNGKTICSYQDEYDRLDEIAYFDFFGGIAADKLAITATALGSRLGLGELRLTPELLLEGWAYDPQGPANQRPTLHVTGVFGTESLFIHPLPRPDLAPLLGQRAEQARPGFAVPLPGWVWQMAGTETRSGEATVTVQAYVGDLPAGAPLEVSREDIRKRIDALAESENALSDTGVLLLAVEHAQFARLWLDLSPTAQRALREAALRFGVSDSLSVENAPLAALAPIPVQRARDEVLAEATFKKVAAALRADPKRDALSLIPEALPPNAVRALHLRLTEYFCAHDTFDVLFARHRALRQPPMRPGLPEDRWHNSTALPYFYCEGDLEALAATFWGLSQTRSGWLNTAAIGWVVRHLLTPSSTPIAPQKLRDLFHAFLELLSVEAKDPFGRAHDKELLRTFAFVLPQTAALPYWLERDFESTALRLYGLSREFWRAVDALCPAPSLTPRLATARAAFAQVDLALAGRATPHEADEALRSLSMLGCAEVERVRRELFGPLGVPDAHGSLPSVEVLVARGLDPDEALIRSLAAPGATEADVRSTAFTRKAIARRYTETGAPSTALAAVRQSALAKARALLSGSGEVGSNALQEFLQHARLVSGATSHFAGLGLMLRLLHGLLRRGSSQDLDAAQTVLAALSAAFAGLPADEAAKAQTAPAVVSALHGLMRLEVELSSGSDPALFATTALSAFPAATAELESFPRVVQATRPTSPLECLFDAWVVVLSCQANLKTRIPVLRETWLADLAAVGVPYLVAVGGAKPEVAGQIIGDVLYLDAPDDYEGLPQKTLALARWAVTNLPQAHLIKIDDDCFLNVEEFFATHAYALFDYYGRRLDRAPGSMDRRWHQAKATTTRGRLELDRSPEPSAYCDGGAGYTLSRRALAALVAAADDPAHAPLIAHSFMEDKLVGDLLARRGIVPANMDYRVSIFRRSEASGVPTSIYENGFFPSRVAPVQLAHLDGVELMPKAKAILRQRALWPRKIWPSFAAARFGENSNSLDLLVEEEKLARLARSPLAVVAVVRNEKFLLPHFLAHYRKLGVEAFLIVDNVSDDGTQSFLLAQPDVALFSADTEYRASTYGVAWQQALLAHFRLGLWTIVVDADEFLVLDLARRMRLLDILQTPEFTHAEGVRTFLLDMYPKGPLAEATFERADPFTEAGFVDREPFLSQSLGRGPYSNQPTWTSAVRHRLIPGSRPELFVAQKIAVLRYTPFMRLSAGLHYVGDIRLAERDLVLAHFKYHAAFHKRVIEEVRRRQHFNDAEEYRKYLALLSEGREVVYDPAISIPWTECQAVRAILGSER